MAALQPTSWFFLVADEKNLIANLPASYFQFVGTTYARAGVG
jgi:hypothetical protein